MPNGACAAVVGVVVVGVVVVGVVVVGVVVVGVVVVGVVVVGVAVVAVPHTGGDIEPGECLNISVSVAFEWTHVSPQSPTLNEVAFLNISFMRETRDTFHLEISWLNALAKVNIHSMVVTRDTSHLEISVLNAFA